MAKQGKPARKARLGRGLSSLIVSSTSPESEEGQFEPDDSPSEAQTPPAASEPSEASATADAKGSPAEIPAEDISPNPYQPRRQFPEAELAELRESIRQQGILQPLIVSPATGQSETPYVLVAGERRLRAAKAAGLETVPCIIRDADSRQMAEWALIENLQRSDLDPIERAEGYQHYIDRFALSTAEAAERLGQARSTVANHLRLLELCDDVRRLISQGMLTFGHAKVLAGVRDPELQMLLAKRVVAKGLSVRALEEALQQAQGENSAKEKSSAGPQSKPPYVRDLEEKLTHTVGTRVAILPGRAKHTGRIVVEYYSLDDFDRIAESLGWQGEEA
ncbi:MAG: ParB/RepB/Spo0J family partition protein [Planctomycetota bacterium]